jgi:hypothetical protein
MLDGFVEYFWRVDEFNEADPNYYWKGDVWSFISSSGATLITKRCTIKAGKTQGKDYITASGTLTTDFEPDLNDINQFTVDIISVDGNLIYTEANIFDVCNVATGKFTYTYRIPRGGDGAITSLKLDFINQTFAITAKDVNLTGLGCTFLLNINLGGYLLVGDVNEAIVNGSRKIIPTRLMRLYKDTLIVTKAKAKNGILPSTDTLSIQGDIAVKDMNDSEPNLVNEIVNITWGGQTLTIPAGNFMYKKGNLFRCRNVPVTGGLMNVDINLDKCTFIVKAKYASLDVTSGEAEFGINFDTPNGQFDEVVDVNLVRGY